MGFTTVLGNCLPNLLFIGALFIGACISLRKHPAVGFGAAAFFLLLAPSSSIIPIISEIMAEHRMYLPSAIVIAFVVLALAYAAPWYISSSQRQRQVGIALLAFGVVGLTWRTLDQNTVYHDEIRFWEVNAEVTPENRRVFHNLATLYEKAGRVDEAHRAYQTALQRSPDYDLAMIEYAHFLATQGDYNRAVPLAIQAVQLLEGLGQAITPKQARYYEILALVLFDTGRLTEAEQACIHATKINPANAYTYRFLAAIQLRGNAFDRALQSYATFLGKESPDAETRELLAVEGEQNGLKTQATALRMAAP